MRKVCWISDNGRWAITPDVTANDKDTVVVTNMSNGITYYPIRYQDGRIAYDFPERVPQYVKEAVAQYI